MMARWKERAMSDDLIRRSDAIKVTWQEPSYTDAINALTEARERIKNIPTIEPNLILPERMERGECYEVGETIVVMNHDDYYDLMCRAMENEPKQGEWIMNDIQRAEDTDNGNYQYTCSVCGYGDIHAMTQEVPYCWWCGSPMKGASK
jgi:hypothetical protein